MSDEYLCNGGTADVTAGAVAEPRRPLTHRRRVYGGGGVALLVAASLAQAQAPDGPLLAARRAAPTVSIKMWVPAGSVRLVGWDRDSVDVRGDAGRHQRLLISGGADGMKLNVEGRTPGDDATAPSRLVVRLPRRAMVSLKGANTDIAATDVGGWYYTVTGSIRLSGSAPSIEAESMNGDVDANVAVPFIRARTGRGSLILRGAPVDVDAGTVSGTLNVASDAIQRAQLGSVDGDIRYAATPDPRAILELSTHSGGIDLLLSPSASATLSLTSVAGSIDDRTVGARPSAAGGASVRRVIGRGDARITARTYRGRIRVGAR